MDKFNIGIISGKLGDVDGVSLEVNKWTHILTELGHTLFTISGRYVNPVESVHPGSQILLEEISFDSPIQRYYEKLAFPYLTKNTTHMNGDKREGMIEELIHEGKKVADQIFQKIQENEIDVLIAQNTNAMPMTLLGGLGVYNLSTDNRLATIFHHHDFWWERSRFSQNHIETLLTQIMPPSDLGTEHVVLSSYSAHILRSLKRVHPHVIPNCEDFDNPVKADEYNQSFRHDLGFSDDDLLIVQPTRIVRRKRIEDSLELVHRLMKMYPDIGSKVHYIISLYQGDESDENYIEEIKEIARKKAVPLHLIHDRVSARRATDDQGRKLYTNRDVLANADLVTYLPIWEGFGNALLEAVALKKPLVTTTYLVYKTDIKVTGLETVEIRDNYDTRGQLVIPDQVVEQIYSLLTHPQDTVRMTERNFEIGRQEFSFDTLEGKVKTVLSEYADEIRASRKRILKSKRSYSV